MGDAGAKGVTAAQNVTDASANTTAPRSLPRMGQVHRPSPPEAPIRLSDPYWPVGLLVVRLRLDRAVYDCSPHVTAICFVRPGSGIDAAT